MMIEDRKMNELESRPSVWVGHVMLETDRLAETEQFMCQIGMRPLVRRSEVAILEMRGGTHLVLIAKPEIVTGEAPFDLMVEDLQASHENFNALGLDPSPIEKVSYDHERFTLREPAGNIICFFSNHVAGRVV